MYIAYNSINYPCTCHPGATMVYKGLPEDFPAPVEGEIALCADDGFIMRTDNTADYLRQTFEDGVLTLTNMPEPEEPEAPDEPEEPVEPEEPATAITDADMAAAILEGVNEI